jgi:hypothetical protein
MRFAITLAATILMFAGCKSKSKHEDSAKPAAPAAAQTEVKKAAKEVKAAAIAVSASKVECKNGGDARVLEVRAKDKGCETAYTKAGQENIVGSSQSGTAHCEGIVTRIKDKLAASGFTCN